MPCGHFFYLTHFLHKKIFIYKKTPPGSSVGLIMVAPYKLHKPISRSSYNEKDRVSDCTIGPGIFLSNLQGGGGAFEILDLF